MAKYVVLKLFCVQIETAQGPECRRSGSIRPAASSLGSVSIDQESTGTKEFTMKTLTMSAAVAGLSVGAVIFAGTAGAVGTGRSADDVVGDLQASGHHVQINGPSSSAPLSQCKATGVHGLRDSNVDSSGSKIDPDQFSTVYVDVVCHNP
jgi:hypothetical protein